MTETFTLTINVKPYRKCKSLFETMESFEHLSRDQKNNITLKLSEFEDDFYVLLDQINPNIGVLKEENGRSVLDKLSNIDKMTSEVEIFIEGSDKEGETFCKYLSHILIDLDLNLLKVNAQSSFWTYSREGTNHTTSPSNKCDPQRTKREKEIKYILNSYKRDGIDLSQTQEFYCSCRTHTENDAHVIKQKLEKMNYTTEIVYCENQFPYYDGIDKEKLDDASCYTIYFDALLKPSFDNLSTFDETLGKIIKEHNGMHLNWGIDY